MKLHCKLLIIGSFVSLFLTSAILLPSVRAAALTGNEFKADRIIDDFVFYSPTPTMTVSQIQSFLNSKVAVCDTNGTQIYSGSQTRAQYSATKGYSPPFTCLKDYMAVAINKTTEAGLCNGFTAGTLSAADLIYKVAESCGVSAKVLLVTLQKEQSLVTDDWPWPAQYQKAMGYGCPDTAPCDAQYYGLFNQLYNAARQFKRYAKEPGLFNYALGRNSFIQYQANNTACGGSYITPSTAATAALYNYTPYQPNAAALANLYGTGDSCSAYGNRNFWRLYRDWFGTTYANDTDVPHPNGTLISGNGRVYLVENNVKKHILTPNIFTSYNYKWSQVQPATTGDLALPDGPVVDNLAPGTIFRSDNTPVYVMDISGGYGKKQQISLQSFNALGYKWSEVLYIPPNEMPALTMEGIRFTDLHPSGTIVLDRTDGGRVYQLNNGTRRYVMGPTAFNTNNLDWGKIKNVTASDKNLPLGPPLDIAPGSILNAAGIYVVQYDSSGILTQPVGPWECYSDRMHYDSYDWTYVEISTLPARRGPLFTC